jgi:hypothetical protein
MKYRFDLVLSYWIFAWFLLHMAGLIRASPKLALCVGLAENILQLCVMFFYGADYVAGFVAINVFIKVLPLYIVWRERIRWREDLENLGILVAAYLLYCVAAGDNPAARLRNMVASWTGYNHHGNDGGEIDAKVFPGMALFNDLFVGHAK